MIKCQLRSKQSENSKYIGVFKIHDLSSVKFVMSCCSVVLWVSINGSDVLMNTTLVLWWS